METPPGRDDADDAVRDQETERAARLAALRSLLSATPGTPPPALPEDDTPIRSRLAPPPRRQRPSPPRRSRRPLALIIGLVAVALLVALGAGLLIHARQPQPTGSTHPPELISMQFAPRSDGLDCPVDIAWSPDGARVAVLGYKDHCPDFPPNAAYTSGLLLIYNVTTGALQQRIALDQFVTGAGGVALDTHTQYLAYQALLWSPDGARLALPFFAQSGMIAAPEPAVLLHGGDPATAPHPTAAGVLLLDAKTFQRTGLVAAPYTASVSSTAPLEWNLITHSLIQPTLPLPPALGYHWGAGGALLPETSLSAGQAPAPAPLGPVGNPSGGASFTIWQPGTTALGFTESHGVGTAVPGLDLFFTRFAAWSPDGAYLLAPAYYGGRIDTFKPPQPTTAQIQAAGWASAPLLSTHDAAMTALYGPTPQDLSLSWSPDGQRLAAWNGGDGRQVIVYGARSGRVVTTLPIPTSSYGSAQLNYSPSLLGEEMRWSSDGKHLALMSLELNSLIVWTLG